MTDRPTAGRVYTNVVLTAIAALLAVQVFQQLPVRVVSQAQAQSGSSSRIPVGEQNIPQTQDVAVAAATSEVAAANREIAAAIKEVASNLNSLSGAIRTAASASASAANAASRPAAGSPSDINISVK